MSRQDWRLLTKRQFNALAERWHYQQVQDDRRFGMLCAVVANFSMGKDPKTPPIQPKEFFPRLREPEPEQTFEEMAAIIHMCAAANAGKS